MRPFSIFCTYRPISSLEQKSLIQLHAKVDRCSLLKERKVNCFNRSRHQQWFKREIRLLLVGNLRQFHQRTIDAGECGAPCQFHRPFEFGVENLQDLLNTVCTIGSQAPEDRAANQHGARA